MSEPKDLNYYLALPYPVVLLPEEDESWSASIPELFGCIGAGDTEEEALETLRINKAIWFAARLDKGWHIPEPSEEAYQALSFHITKK